MPPYDPDVQSMSGVFRFMDLPYELRAIEIYHYMTPLTKGFVHAEYRGLYLSCSQVKQEMDKECTRAMRALVEAASDSICSNAFPFMLRLSQPPANYSQLRRLAIGIFPDYFKSKSPLFSKSILPLLDLRLEELVISIEFDYVADRWTPESARRIRHPIWNFPPIKLLNEIDCLLGLQGPLDWITRVDHNLDKDIFTSFSETPPTTLAIKRLKLQPLSVAGWPLRFKTCVSGILDQKNWDTRLFPLLKRAWQDESGRVRYEIIRDM